MAFSEIEQKRYEKAVEKYLETCRPPVEIRDQVDIGYRLDGQAIEIFEIRPRWNDPSEKIEHPVARVKYYKSRNEWKIYWMKSDLKWHAYEPIPEVKFLEVFFEILQDDAYGCFWG
ncbi:TPA: DUF3024 domain-containing protein [Vibrio cholerae]|uniref:DUF3024 domain-containing protein n=2 Tax=Vibrio TaxID=662 RepID=A0AAU8WND5_9VIBR|nr:MULTISPECIES: DUF3024 domain-containing protein [Vibrio]EJE4200691.1 DUF3024 domain-containing protein [Vibrio cholerae]ASK53466.1 hypothetical protein CEQ48_01235 [Vibrio tarriae]ELE5868257.1 DUF3024 domain-containing protein [Vibrio cholerae]ELG7084234.1 DUF3024 domain-containing protein [Vibrio cholerae]KQA97960.1 hypothetical protein XV92_17685 [Vibrio metoecus]